MKEATLHQISVKSYQQYFERTQQLHSNRYETATKLKRNDNHYIPDSLIHLGQGNKDYLYCFELHNGYRIQRIEKKMRAYAYIISN